MPRKKAHIFAVESSEVNNMNLTSAWCLFEAHDEHIRPALCTNEGLKSFTRDCDWISDMKPVGRYIELLTRKCEKR